MLYCKFIAIILNPVYIFGKKKNKVSVDTEKINNIQKSVTINRHYVKDLSFENPRAPYSLIENEQQSISFHLDVKVEYLNDNIFEVVIVYSIKASSTHTIFVVDLSHAGLFTLADDIDQEAKEEILFVKCPEILFPHASRIIHDITRDGGYPPLLLPQVDFMLLYQNKKMPIDK